MPRVELPSAGVSDSPSAGTQGKPGYAGINPFLPYSQPLAPFSWYFRFGEGAIVLANIVDPVPVLRTNRII